MHEPLIPVGPPRVKTPLPENEAGTSQTEPTDKKIPMLIRGIGVHQVIPKEATRDVLSGKVAFYLVDDRDGVTLFPAKHIFSALKLDQEHKVKFEDFSCLGGHERFLALRPQRREGMGYRRRFISPELLNRGIYWSVHLDIRIRALNLMATIDPRDIRKRD